MAPTCGGQTAATSQSRGIVDGSRDDLFERSNAPQKCNAEPWRPGHDRARKSSNRKGLEYGLRAKNLPFCHLSRNGRGRSVDDRLQTVGPYPYATRHAAVRWRWGDAVISRIVFVVGGFHCAAVRPSLTRTERLRRVANPFRERYTRAADQARLARNAKARTMAAR